MLTLIDFVPSDSKMHVLVYFLIVLQKLPASKGGFREKVSFKIKDSSLLPGCKVINKMLDECMLPLAQATENNENFSAMFDQNQDSKAGLKCF